MNIHLKNIRLFGHHGLYQIEKEHGNWFLVHISLLLDTPTNPPVYYNHATMIDYLSVYETFLEVFTQPEELLENLCIKINTRLLAQFSQALSVRTSIQKEKIPLENISATFEVSLETKR